MTYCAQQIWAAPETSGFPTAPIPCLTPSSVWSSDFQVNKLKREMVHLQHELQFKERGFQTLKK